MNLKGELISIYCPFCHRYTSLTHAPGSVYPPAEYEYPHVVLAIWEKNSQEIWWIGICNSCHNAVLVHTIKKEDRVIRRDIYPHPLPQPSDERIPEHIRKDLDEAKICLSVNAYRACAVMARRAIQSACIDKGADKNKKLEKQIEELAQNGIITKDLKEWADVVRWVGNDAAHPDTQDVTREDAEDILNLSEEFMHVIYVAPAIAKERKEKRRK